MSNPGGPNQWSDDDDMPGSGKPTNVFKEFDCPDCNANNPCDPPIGEGDEVLCNYCGSTFDVRVKDGGKLKLKAN